MVLLLALLATLLGAPRAAAHVGSPNVFFEGMAGPYAVRVVIRPPGVVPGLAEISVRLQEPAEMVSIRLFRWDVGEDGAPPAEPAIRVVGDDELFSAELWLMTAGAHSVEVSVQGSAGGGIVLVPFESVRRETLEMGRWYGAMLVAMGLFLFVGAVTLCGASARQSTLEPGADADAGRRRRGWITTAVASLLLAIILWSGWHWWSAVDAAYRAAIFAPLPTVATVEEVAGTDVLDLEITDERWVEGGWSPLVPDHGKLMHMFLVRDDLGAFAHVHPVAVDDSRFRLQLPPLPGGGYRVYADIVHESGFSQTLVNEIDLRQSAVEPAPATELAASGEAEETGESPAPTAGERAWAVPAIDPDDSWTVGLHSGDSVVFDDGTAVEWVRPAGPIATGDDLTLEFQVRDAAGAPAALEPYMGMLSHSVITREDGEVFVHLHPAGSISMGALMVASQRRNVAAGHMQRGESGRVAFPYAFPRAGDYRVWVQLKRDGRIYTADFEATVR